MQGKYFLTTLCFVYIFPNIIAITKFGNCPNDIGGMMNFDPKMFQGVWYEIQEPIFSVAASKKCSYNIVVLTDDNLHQVKYVTYDGLFGTKSTEMFNITVVNSDMPQPDGVRKDYILGTDYENYGVYYHCKNGIFGLSSQVDVGVLGRERTLDKASQKAVDGILEKYGFAGSLVKINQKHCPARSD